MSDRAATWEQVAGSSGWVAFGLLLRPLHLALAFPSVLYLAALTVFLFRPPDLYFYYADRIAFCVLALFAGLRILAYREKLPFIAQISVPMLGLAALAVFRAGREPLDPQTWSLVASKFIVPFTLFHLAIVIFRSATARAHFEFFVIAALAYLIFTALAWLVDAPSLIFPRFILDESLGIHADRARGPFLQAVANGVSLNILGLLAVAFSQSRRKLTLLLWLFLPLAVLATLTRAVWIAFAFSVAAIGFRVADRCIRNACVGLACAGLLLGLVAALSRGSLTSALTDRTGDRSSVDVRWAVYDSGWEMFKERPFTGWPAGGMYVELARRMQGYDLRQFYIHNTYLSVLIEFGLPGLVLYGILFFNLFRLARSGTGRGAGECESISALRRIWPILLCVYLFNAFFVDMAYQFVIGLLFTVAGMLCASAEAAS